MNAESIIFVVKIVIALLFLGIMLLIAKPLYLTLKERHEKRKKEKAEIPTAKNKKQIALEELSKIWRIECFDSEESMKKHEEEIVKKVKEEITENIPQETHSIIFNNERLNTFYDKYLKGKKAVKPEEHDVAVEVMKLLDEKGSCPSVVQNPTSGDFDSTRLNTKKNEFDLLSQITLLDHSLDVAEELLRMHNYSLVTMARDIIAALGHDLGKIPEYHVNKYVTGEHPTISLYVLSKVQGFKDLSYVDDIKDAIKKHHISPQKPFSKDLKAADQRAREKELEALIEENFHEESSPNPQQKEEEKPKENSKPSNSSSGAIPIDPYVERAKQEKAVGGNETKKNKIDDSGIDIEWFSPEKMLMIIKDRYLNKAKGRGFDAFSTKNGYVFVQSGRIMDVFLEMAKQEGRVQDYDINDREQRKAINLKIVNVMRESGYLADEYVRKGYFGGYFKITFKPGTYPEKNDTLTGFFVPFYATAFSSNIAELEATKEGILKNVVNVEIVNQR